MATVDVGDRLGRISAARRAAEDLRIFAAGLSKHANLRDDSNAVAAEALELLREFENKALHPECNLLPETIGRAALKAEDALKVLQGKVATAARKSKGGIMGMLANPRKLVNGHKKIFKEARDGLAAARAAMDKEDLESLTSSEEGDPFQQPQQQQLATQQGPSELHLSWDRGVRVSSVALTPRQDGCAASPTLLVGLNRKVELYPGCSSTAKTEVQLSDKAQVVTCVAYDPATLNVWTGCADGSVLLHARGRWGFASLATEVGLPVRAMAVDSSHCCWVGDEAGIIRVLTLDIITDRLGVRFRVIPPQARGLVRLATSQGPAAAAPAASGPPGAAGKCVPVHAMLGRGPAVFASGSKAWDSITVFNSQNYQVLEVANCESFGATCCFAVLPWETDDAEQQAAAAFAGQGAGVAQSMPAVGAVPGIPATGIAVGYAAPIARATVPASVMAHQAAKAGGMVGQLPAGQLAAGAADSGWRLLTGHERGQVLLWQLKGVQRSPTSPRVMHLLCVIGEAKPRCAVRGMAVFPDLQMLVLAQSSGSLTALPMPTPHNGAVAAPGRAATFAAVGVPASRSLPLGGGALPSGPGMPALHTWLPRVAQIKAHKNGIETATSLGELLVTASTATVKSWTAERLKLEAQGDGLMFSRQSSVRRGAQSTSAALQQALAGDAAAAAAASAAGRREPAHIAAAAAAALAGAAAASDDASSSGGTSSQSASRSGTYAQSLQDSMQQQPPPSSPMTPAAAAGAFAPDGSSMSSFSGVMAQPASSTVSTSSSRPPVASVVSSNPMSRANAVQRGLQVDAKGTVVVQPKNDPMQQLYSSTPGLSVPPHLNTGHLPLIPPVGMAGGAPPTSMQQYPPLLPPGTAPNSVGGVQSSLVSGSASTNSGLETSSSVQPGEGIKLHHVICNSELVLKEVIGSGAEGKVYRGTWTNIDVAAKEYLAVDDCEVAAGKNPSELAMQRARDALRKEVALLTSLNHPNLVRFCGVCLDPPLVVMEYYRHGNVYSMLEKARRQWSNLSAKTQHSRQATKYMKYFNWDRRLEMLHDVAAGMMYLHKRHYVHGDLRSPNLFVGLDGRVKIGDFGFTKRLSGNKASMQVKRITHPRWVAPELMTQNRLSTASDVYSYAIIMYEMLTWQMPFHDLSKEQVVLRVMSGGRPELLNEEELPPGTSSSTCLGNYMKLMEECWDQDPDKRPSFDKIAARLKAMIRWRMVINKCRLQSSTMLAFAGTRGSVKAAATAAAARRANGVLLGPAAPAAAGAAGVGTAAVLAKAAAPPAAEVATPFAAAVPAAAEQTDHEHDQDPLPRPAHPITTAATGDSDLPLPLPEGAGGGPIIMNLSRQLSARVLQQAGLTTAAAVENDGDTLDAGPFGVPEAAAGLPAPAAVAAAAAAEQPGASVVAVPGGGCIVIGSDVAAGSPPSSFTLSTRNSTEAGMSMTTAGLSTPPASGTTWEGQLAKPQQQQQQQQLPSMAGQGGQACSLDAATEPQAPGSPPPPGYPSPFTQQGLGYSAGPHAALPQLQVRSVATPAAAAADSSVDVGGFGAAAGAAAAAAALADAGGLLGAGSAGAGSVGSVLLAGASKSTRLDPIQESSEATSATISSRDSKALQLHNQQQQAAAGASVPAAASVSSAPVGYAEGQQGINSSSNSSGRDTAAMALASVGPFELAQQDLQAVNTGDTSSRVADWLTNQPDAHLPQAHAAPSSATAAAAAAAGAAHGASAAAAAAAAAATEPDVDDEYGAFAVQQQQQQQQSQGFDDMYGAFATLQVQEQQQQEQQAAVAAADDLEDTYGAFAVQQQQQELKPDFFTAEDSPFFISPGNVPASNSIDMGGLFAAAQAPQGAAAAVAASVGSSAAARSTAIPAYMDADYLDDSCLQPLDDEGPGLGAAVTLVYQEGLTPAEAANQSSYTIKSSNFSGCTLPSLDGGVASGGRGGSSTGGSMQRAAGGYPASRPDSFTVDAGPFAAMNMTADLCESTAPASTAGGAVPVSMGDSPFAAAGGIDVASSVAEPTAAAGGAQQGQLGVDGSSFGDSPFATAAAGAGVAAAAAGVAGPGAIATASGARQASPSLPAGSPRQRSPTALAGHMQQLPAGVGGADMAVGWLQTIGLAAAGRPQQAAAGQVHPDYMTGGQAPAVPDAVDGRRMSSSSRTSSYTPTAGTPASMQSSMAGAAAGPARGVSAPAGALAGAAAAAEADGQPPDSMASGPHYSKPLDDRILNKPLGTAKEEEDLVTKAQRDLRAWESRTSDKSSKLRHTSGTSGSQPGSTNSSDPSGTALAGGFGPQMQQDGSLPSPFAAAGGSSQMYPPGAAAGAAPAGWPPAGMLPGGGLAAPAVSAAPAGPGGYPMAGPMAIPYSMPRSASSFDQVAPGERVTVVNRPFNPAAASMDAGGIPSSTPGSSMPAMHMHSGWAGAGLSSRTVSGPPSMMYAASPGGIPASGAVLMQQQGMAMYVQPGMLQQGRQMSVDAYSSSSSYAPGWSQACLGSGEAPALPQDAADSIQAQQRLAMMMQQQQAQQQQVQQQRQPVYGPSPGLAQQQQLRGTAYYPQPQQRR